MVKGGSAGAAPGLNLAAWAKVSRVAVARRLATDRYRRLREYEDEVRCGRERRSALA